MKRVNVLITGIVLAALLVIGSNPSAQAAWSFYQNSYYRFYYSTTQSGDIAKALSLSHYFGIAPFVQAQSVIGQTGMAGKFGAFQGRIPVFINAVADPRRTGTTGYIFNGNTAGLTSQYLMITHYQGVNSNVLTGYGRTLARLTSQLFFTNTTGLYNNNLFWTPASSSYVAGNFQGNYRFFRDAIAQYTELSVYAMGPRWGYQQIRTALHQSFQSAGQCWFAAQNGTSRIAQLSVGYVMSPRIKQFVASLYSSRLVTVYGEAPCQMAPGRAPFKRAVFGAYGVQYGDFGSWQNIPGYLSYSHKIYWGLS